MEFLFSGDIDVDTLAELLLLMASNEGLVAIYSMLLVVALLRLALWFRQPKTVAVTEAPKPDPRARKNVLVAYMFLLCGGGFIGAHHYYLGNYLRGICYTCTLGFLGLGPAYDMFTLRSQVRRINVVKGLTGEVDMSVCGAMSRIICKWIPILFVALVFAFAIILFFGPKMLDAVGIIDLYALKAGISANPYKILEVPPGSSFLEAKKNFRVLSLKYHPDRNPTCTECPSKMAELNVALATVKKLGGVPSANIKAQGWLEDLSELDTDWSHVLREMERYYTQFRAYCGSYCSFIDRRAPKKKKWKKGKKKAKKKKSEL